MSSNVSDILSLVHYLDLQHYYPGQPKSLLALLAYPVLWWDPNREISSVNYRPCREMENKLGYKED